MTRELTLCADDYGLSPAVDRGILALVRRGRLSMVTCLVNGPAWGDDATALAAPTRKAPRMGLHLNLTEGRPLSNALLRVWPELPTLSRLITDAHLGRLPLVALHEEVQAQWRAFVRSAGRAPDVVDGHQHVHHLPGLRDLVMALPGAAVRDTGRLHGPGFGIKRLLIEGTGGRALSRRLVASGRRANATLAGVYDFAAPDYRRLMRGWLAALPERGGMIFCHPGESSENGAGAGAGDPIAAARTRELAYLAGADFDADLEAAGVRLLTGRKSSRG